MHINPLLAEYISLAQVMYKNFTPPDGDITPDTLPGFRKSKVQVNLSTIHNDYEESNYYKKYPNKVWRGS